MFIFLILHVLFCQLLSFIELIASPACFNQCLVLLLELIIEDSNLWTKTGFFSTVSDCPFYLTHLHSIIINIYTSSIPTISLKTEHFCYIYIVKCMGECSLLSVGCLLYHIMTISFFKYSNLVIISFNWTVQFQWAISNTKSCKFLTYYHSLYLL